MIDPGNAAIIASLSMGMTVTTILWLRERHMRRDVPEPSEVQPPETERCPQSERRVQRMAAVGTMTSGVAHNFNNLIGTIDGFCDLAKAHSVPGTPVHRYLGEIDLAAKRARDLIDRILDYGRHMAARDIIVASDLIEQTVRLSRGILASNVEIVVEAPRRDLLIEASDVEMQQVLMNLVANAGQAMPGGGAIQIFLESESLDPVHSVRGDTLSAGPYVRITVADRGAGIAPDRLARIFEPFYTTRQDGTGLGLSTAREIVRSRGGTIEVESELGEGSRFTIRLPEKRAEDVSLCPENVASLRGEDTRVYVLGDMHIMPPVSAQLIALNYHPIRLYDVEDLIAADAGPRDVAIIIGPTTSLLAEIEQADVPLPVMICADDRVTSRYVSLHWPLRIGELAARLKVISSTNAQDGSVAQPVDRQSMPARFERERS